MISRVVFEASIYRLVEVAESSAMTASRAYYWEHKTSEDRMGVMRWENIGENHSEDLLRILASEIGNRRLVEREK